ncbi:HEPN domain-containing protein [Pedobacter sp. UYP24]
MELQLFKTVDEHASDLRSFIKLLADKFKPIQIISFSNRLSFQGATGLFIDQKLTCQGHYCLLMVTETNVRIDHEVQDYCNSMYNNGTITILSHGQASIKDAIEKNNRFFINVYASGQLLYSHDGISLLSLSVRFNPTQIAIKAKKHYEHRINLADGFLTGARECLQNQQYNVCTFMLHQVVEQCCIGLIRVFLAYRSEVHNLNRLLRLCGSFSNIPYSWFLTGRLFEEKLLEILVRSYSQARYGQSFSVDEIDAKCLFEKISAFVQLTREMCELKISEFENSLIKESEVENG